MKAKRVIEKWEKLRDSNYNWIVDDFIIDLKWLLIENQKISAKRKEKNKEYTKKYNKMYYEKVRRKQQWRKRRYNTHPN